MTLLEFKVWLRGYIDCAHASHSGDGSYNKVLLDDVYEKLTKEVTVGLAPVFTPYYAGDAMYPSPTTAWPELDKYKVTCVCTSDINSITDKDVPPEVK